MQKMSSFPSSAAVQFLQYLFTGHAYEQSTKSQKTEKGAHQQQAKTCSPES
jgi:hypothetical protein